MFKAYLLGCGVEEYFRLTLSDFDKDKFFKYYSSIAVFLFFALSLVLPSGYSYGAAMLIIPSLFLLPKTYKALQTSTPIKTLSILLLIYFLVFFISFLSGDIPSRELDGPVRFLFIIPILLFLYQYPPNTKSTFLGIALGASLAGVFSIYQKETLNLSRVGGHMAVIEFGNIAILYAILSASSITRKNKSYLSIYNVLMIIAFFLGLAASILSGTRAGWISIILLLFVLLKKGKGMSYIKSLLITITCTSIFFITLYNTPNTGFKNRIDSAHSDISEYFNNKNKSTSIGLRLEMWKLSSYLILEKPLLGWGEDGYIDRGREISLLYNIEKGALDFNHVHNEILNATLKHGIFGLFSLLSLYIFFIRIFSQALIETNKKVAISGLIFILCIIDFGLSNVFLNRNSGVMIFCFTSVILLSLVYKDKEN